jgi:thiamine biosynthesis lipoprotein
LPGLFVLTLFVTLWVRRPEPLPPPPPQWELSGAIFGTTWTVKVVASADATDAALLSAAIERTLARVDNTMSTYKPDSELSILNANSALGAASLSPELGDLLKTSARIHRWTGGAFDVTVGPLVNAWGFGPDSATQPSDEARADAAARVGAAHLTYDPTTNTLSRDIPGIYIDLSGIAKGYAVDRVAEVVERDGHSRYLVEIGGEVRTHGLSQRGTPWAVGIETPDGGVQDTARVVTLDGLSLATSGNYRNLRVEDGRTVTHIIDPRSGQPVSHGLGSVSVIAADCTEADALATALYVLGWDEGFEFAERSNIAALFLRRANGEETKPPGPEERATTGFTEIAVGRGLPREAERR